MNRNIKFIENMSQVGVSLSQNKNDAVESPQKKSEQGNKSINPSKQKSERASQKQNQNVNEGSHKSKQASIKSSSKKQVSQRQWSAVYENENFGIDMRNINKEAVFKKKDEKIQASQKKSLQQIQWEAAYIDEKYYLSDPASLAKLRELENQIEIEKQKLINIEVAEKFDKSFLSQRPLNSSGDNERQQILTQINDSILFHRKETAEQDLLNQEQKYRNKIEDMKKKKSILKKEIGCGTNDKNLQVNASEIIKNQEQAAQEKVEKEKVSKVEKSEKKSQKVEEVKEDILRKSASAQVENSVKKTQKEIKVSQKAESQKKSAKLQIEKSIEKQKSRKSSKQKEPSTKQQINLPQLHTNLKYTADGVSETPKKTQKSVRQQEIIQKSKKDAKPEQNEAAPSQKQQKPPSQKNSTSKSKIIESQKKQETQLNKSVLKKQTHNLQSNKSEINHEEFLKVQNTSRAEKSVKSPSVIQKSVQQNYQKSMKSSQLQKKQEKQEKQKSKKSAQIKQSSPSEHTKKQTEKELSEKKEGSHTFKKQEAQLNHEELFKVQNTSRAEKSVKSPSVVQKSVQQNYQKSMKSSHLQKSTKKQQKQEKQKSKKSVQIKQSSPSEHTKKQTEKQLTEKKEGSHISHSQKDKKSSLPPQILVNGQAFKKTDNKSVQWEEIEIQSSSKHALEKSIKEKEVSIHSKPEKSQKQPSQHNIETKSKKSQNLQQKSKAQSVYKKDQSQNQSRVFSESPSQNKDAISHKSYKTKNEVEDSKSNKKEISERSVAKEISVSHQQKSVRNSQVQHDKSLKQSAFSKKQEENLQNSRKLFSEKEPSEIHVSEKQISQKQKQYQSEQRVQNEPGSEKKKTSFKIHSRESSVKSKRSSSRPSSYHNIDKGQLLEHSKIISNSNKKKAQLDHSQLRERNSSVTQLQIKNLHQHIAELQEKLKRVEEKQEQMIKFENNQSNIMSQIQASHAASGSQPVSPLGKFNFNSRLKLQAKLTLEGSTVHFNTYEEQMKKTAEDNEKLQKLRLQEEIGRLKKIIRDMQMQKIKSIQYDPNESLYKIEPRKSIFLDSQEVNKEKIEQKWKDSLNSEMLETKKHEWNTETLNKEEAGKIKKNSPGKFHFDSPRKYNRINAQKSKQYSQIAKQQEKEQAPLPLRRKAESVHSAVHGATVRRDLTKSDLINKFEENEKNFHQFIESSRLIPQEPESYIQGGQSSMPQNFEQRPIVENPVPIHSHIHNSPSSPVEQKKMAHNFSQIVQKLKYENPQDEIKIPSEITIGNITMPNLPQSPNLSMSQDDFLELAKKTYLLFGITIDEKQNELCMKKYKNCVVFTFGNNQQNTVLWHYSGKFYFGGWKNTSDPGQGQKIGEGLEYIPGKHIYKGQFLGGKKNGNGILKTANGNIYDGQWVEGIKNGRGVYFEASTGTYYSGQWKDGKRDGYGILKFSNNQFYEGTFVKSIKQGYGVEKFANEDFYKGEYQKGKFHGKGRYCWANGSSYEGDFVDGCRHGQGTWRSSRKSGDIYVGGYQNDKKSGYGRYVWANGCIYEGYFKNDLKNGKGRLMYQDGKQIKGSWHDGNLVSSDQQSRKPQDHEEEPLRRSIRASSLKNSMNPPQYRNPVHL